MILALSRWFAVERRAFWTLFAVLVVVLGFGITPHAPFLVFMLAGVIEVATAYVYAGPLARKCQATVRRSEWRRQP